MSWPGRPDCSDEPDRLADPLASRVRATPDRTALVAAADGSTWRYAELDALVEGMAGRLADLDLEPGDHLGLLAETSVEAVRLIHAAWRLGLRLVPINVRLADREIERQADRADLDALACDETMAETATIVDDCPIVTLGPSGDFIADGDPREHSTDWPPPAAISATWGPDDSALMLFTSGTTGEPKAVELTMGNLLASSTASALRLGVLPTDRWLLCLPVYHMGGLAPVLRSAHYGTTLVVQEGFDPGAVVRVTREYDVTGLSLVPTQLGRILDAGTRNAGLGRTVRTILLGGAPAQPELIDRCRRLDVPVHPTYGLTETASQVATATPEQAISHEGTVGQPLLDTEVTIVDEDGAPLPADERGEIVVSGPTVTPGYYDYPGATRRAFGPHGLRTGDLGYRDEDGRLWVTGRRGDRIVTGGENVGPETVAAAIRDHPGVSDVAVVGLPDPDWGERVAALVVPEFDESATSSQATPAVNPADSDDVGRDLDAEALLGFCRERLADFEVPKTIAFADELPRTASGTVDRGAVRDRLAECGTGGHDR